MPKFTRALKARSDGVFHNLFGHIQPGVYYEPPPEADNDDEHVPLLVHDRLRGISASVRAWSISNYGFRILGA